MNRKIYINMCFLIAITVLFTTTLTLLISYNQFSEQVKSHIQNEAEYIVYYLEENTGELDLSKKKNDNRITFISKDGTVLFDNQADISKMENHLNRPEIADALNLGIGKSTRLSETFQEKTYYYALRLKSGKVLRVAATTDSMLKVFIRILPLNVLIALFIFLVALFLARSLTKNIVAPINHINFENIEELSIYEELTPFVYKIHSQNNQIQFQMEQLKIQKNKMEAITQNMNEALVMIDGNGLILSLNNSAVDLFKAKGFDFLGKSYMHLTRDLKVISGIKAALSGSKGTEVIHLDDSTYQFFFSPVFEVNKVSGAILLFIDISEKEKTEKVRREFSANVSHELKTPLTTIFGYAQMINNGMAKDEDLLRFTNKIEKEAQRLIGLIESIIKLSELDEEGHLKNKQQISLQVVAKEVLVSLEPALKNKNITARIDGDDVNILGDQSLLNEMIFNLCDNAIKYNKQNGVIQIKIWESESNAYFSVQDSGIGIPKEDLDRIFERFYRVDKSHSKAIEGSGLGLSIVKHIALTHHAKIMIESELNEFTKITVQFKKA